MGNDDDEMGHTMPVAWFMSGNAGYKQMDDKMDNSAPPSLTVTNTDISKLPQQRGGDDEI